MELVRRPDSLPSFPVVKLLQPETLPLVGVNNSTVIWLPDGRLADDHWITGPLAEVQLVLLVGEVTVIEAAAGGGGLVLWLVLRKQVTEQERLPLV